MQTLELISLFQGGSNTSDVKQNKDFPEYFYSVRLKLMYLNVVEGGRVRRSPLGIKPGGGY